MISNDDGDDSSHVIPPPLPSNKKYKSNLSEILSFNFEEWYSPLTQLTSQHQQQFEGFWAQHVKSIKLTQNEMIDIIIAYQKLHTVGDEENCNNFVEGYHGLKTLKEKINQTLLLNENISYFVRCGPRSPKDSRGGIPEINFSDQVIKLLIESERIFKDIHLYLENRNELIEKNKYNFYLHLIPWRSFKKENELRCFFHKKQLVAITQYDLQLNYPFRGKESTCVHIIQTLMGMCGNALKNVIPYDNFVMDVEISTTTERNCIYIIEFNPYGKEGTTGPVHFDWIKDESILFPTGTDENNINVHFRFSQSLTARFEEVIIPPLSNDNLSGITIEPFPKFDRTNISQFEIPNQVGETFLDYL